MACKARTAATLTNISRISISLSRACWKTRVVISIIFVICDVLETTKTSSGSCLATTTRRVTLCTNIVDIADEISSSTNWYTFTVACQVFISIEKVFSTIYLGRLIAWTARIINQTCLAVIYWQTVFTSDIKLCIVQISNWISCSHCLINPKIIRSKSYCFKIIPCVWKSWWWIIKIVSYGNCKSLSWGKNCCQLLYFYSMCIWNIMAAKVTALNT